MTAAIEVFGLDPAASQALITILQSAYHAQADQALESRSGIGAGDRAEFYAWARTHHNAQLQPMMNRKTQGITWSQGLADAFEYCRSQSIEIYALIIQANNESAVMLLTDEPLKKIAHELTENLRQNLSVDWSERESVRAKLRLMVKRILRKYKYPPDLQDGAVELVLQQAQVMGEAWAV